MTLDYFQNDRRIGPDILVKSLTWIAASGWLLMLIALFLLEKAKPITRDFYDRLLGVKIEVQAAWDQTVSMWLFILMMAGLCLSLIGLYINSKRHKRRDDTYRISLVLLGIVSLVGIIIYVI